MRLPVFVMTLGVMAALSGIAALGVTKMTGSVLPDALAQVNATIQQVNASLDR